MKNEICPFCRTEVPVLASVCTGCHAFKRTNAQATSKREKVLRLFAPPMGLAILISYIITPMLTYFGMGAHEASNKSFGFAFLLFWVLLVLNYQYLYQGWANKIIWQRRH